jgi:hypothetical protein
VDGILFKACHFENNRSIYSDGYSLQLGQGIYSLDANYQVQPGCSVIVGQGPSCPPEDLEPCVFRGLDHGIDASDAATQRNFTVQQARFENNVCGVYADAVVGFEVHQSDFILGKRTLNLSNPSEANWLGRHRGIYSYNSYGFLVDDDSLWLDPNATTTQTEGIVTGYSYGHNDMVFRNHAIDLETGFVGEGICADHNHKPTIGLYYQCNTNSGNQTDIWDRQIHAPEANPLTYPDQTIRTDQGSVLRVADNTFDQTCGGDLDIDNTNKDYNVIDYYWALPSAPYEPICNSAGVGTQHLDSYGNPLGRDPNNCASRILSIPVPPDPHTPGGQVELRAAADSDKAAYGNTRYLYDQLINGGSTDATVQEIEESWPEDAWELRASLLDKSPFLTVDVLKEMMDRNTMPQAMEAEVCIANPDATKQDGFMKWFQYDAAYPLPQYLIDNITASWDTRTYRTSMENDMAFHHGEMTQALDMALSGWQTDTLYNQVDSVRAVWQELLTPAARYAEALTYMEQANFDSAQAVITRLPNEYKLSDPESIEQTHMLALIGFLQGIYADGRTETDLDSGEVAQLQVLVNTGVDRATEWGQNLLCFGYGICRAPLTGGDAGEQKSLIMHGASTAPVTPALSIYPNPASSYATFAYDMKAAPDHAYFVIRDVSGRELKRMDLLSTQGQTLWDTRQIAPGTYAIELVNAGVNLASSLLVVKP